MNFLAFSRCLLSRRGIAQRNLLMGAFKMQTIYFSSTPQKPKKIISLENIGEEEDDIGNKLKFDDRKAIPTVLDGETVVTHKEQEKKNKQKPNISLKQVKQAKPIESTSKSVKEETKIEVQKEQVEKQPVKTPKVKKWKDIRLGTLELTEENVNPIIKALREIEEEEARKEAELIARAGITEGMIKSEETKPKEGEKEEKKEEEATSVAAPPLPVSEKEKKKLAKLKKKAKAKGKKLPKKVDKEKEEKEKKKKEEEEKKKALPKVKKQYTPIEYREIAGYQVPKGLTSRMIEKIYAQQLYRNTYTPLSKPVSEYINDKKISITDLPTIGIAFERIRRYTIGNKDQPKRIWVDYFIKRCYEEGKAAYSLKIARVLTRNFFDFSTGMSSMLLDTIGMYKPKDVVVDIMNDITQYRLFPSASYIESLIIRYALDGNILMVDKLIFMYTSQYKYPKNPHHLFYKVMCFKKMQNYTAIWNFLRLNEDKLDSETLEYIIRLAMEQNKTIIASNCRKEYEKRLEMEKLEKKVNNPVINEIKMTNKSKKVIEQIK